MPLLLNKEWARQMRKKGTTMKRKKLIKKLKIERITVAHLTDIEKEKLKGGELQKT